MNNDLKLVTMSDTYRNKLPAFYVDVFTELNGPQDEILRGWTEDLASGKHPTMSDDDFWMFVNEDDEIVSALLLIPQVWSYEGIPFPAGRVELVATHKDYRRRGLIRDLMQAAHDRSESLGHLVQGITGIPYFYRQFGYAMALNLGGVPFVPFGSIPNLEEGKSPEFTLRRAAEDDIPQLMAWQQYYARQNMVSVERTAEIWRYEITARQMGNPASVHFYVIEKDGQGVGYVGIGDLTYGNRLNINEYVVGDASSYLATWNDVMRGIRQYAIEKDEALYGVRFDSGVAPAIYQLAGKMAGGSIHANPYAWYVRVPDLAAFILKITPVLESRLDQSGANRFSGQIHINFYDKTGLLMVFEDGKLTAAENKPTPLQKEDGGFPYLSFLNLMFGHHSLKDITDHYPDAWANSKATVVLDALFPKKKSWVIGLM
jgi:GNAT superfamily N-acetyltransferase